MSVKCPRCTAKGFTCVNWELGAKACERCHADRREHCVNGTWTHDPQRVTRQNKRDIVKAASDTKAKEELKRRTQ